ncbi:MAG: hypothetical protein QGG36_00410 [Pirellulaceae bacterium]|jgi:hypothetical protein|nr:hypothetical protein [Pirellulaceae bacterium]MDP7014238.1 hypothetical protein [Pirellulaceae bacterium]
MKRATILLVALAACFFSGCSMCCGPFDNTYSAFGGSWERHDMTHGRVGSAFAEAGGHVEVTEDGDSLEQIDSSIMTHYE